jgi:hypothetical protein
MKTQAQTPLDLRPRTKAAALRQLDEEFESVSNRSSGRLKQDAYFARRAEIEAWPDIEPPKTITSAPAKTVAPGVTWKTLERVFERIGAETAKLIKERLAPTEKRASELADAIVQMTHAVERLDARLSAAESAEAMEQLKKGAATLVSFDRRLSRMSDHLGRVETRLKNLEHER